MNACRKWSRLPVMSAPQLTEDELRIVVDELAARLERRKRIEIRGLLLAVAVILVGMVWAFWAMGTWPERQLGWLLFIPLALGGLIIKASTALASRSMRRPGPAPGKQG